MWQDLYSCLSKPDFAASGPAAILERTLSSFHSRPAKSALLWCNLPMPPIAQYERITNDLREEIRASYQPGQFLPSEASLAQRFQVNRHTVRRALEMLSHEGLVLRRQGRGTVVLGRRIDYRIAESTRFTESIEAEGMSPAGELLDKGLRVPPADVSEAIAEPIDEPVVWLEQRRLANGVPLVVSSHFLPRRYDWLLDEFSGGSLHAAILGRTGIKLRQMETTVSTALPTPSDAALLYAPNRIAVMTVSATNHCVRSGSPIEHFIGRFRGDAVKFLFMPGELPTEPDQRQ